VIGITLTTELTELTENRWFSVCSSFDKLRTTLSSAEGSVSSLVIS
jgi:hypothetical protein